MQSDQNANHFIPIPIADTHTKVWVQASHQPDCMKARQKPLFEVPHARTSDQQGDDVMQIPRSIIQPSSPRSSIPNEEAGRANPA